MTIGNQRRKLTPTMKLEILAWHKARKALGTFKTKAKECGTTPAAISEFLAAEKRREAKARRAKNSTRMAVYEQFNRLPF